MQGNDRNQSRMDTPFTDHGWMEMRKMLDQEMPVSSVPLESKKNTNYLLLLLFLLFGFAAGVVTMIYFDEDSTPAEPAEQMEAREVAVLDLIPKTDISTNQKASSAMGGGGIPTGVEFGSSATIPKTNKSIDTDSNSGKNFANDPNLYSNSSLAIVPLKNLEKIIPVVESRDNPMNFAVESRIVVQSENHLPEFLETLDIHAEPTSFLTSLPFIELAKNKKVHFGFRLGTHSRSFNDFAGISTAAVISVPIDPGFAFEIGIQYSLLCGFEKNADNSQINNTPFVVDNEENRVNLDYISSVQPIGVNRELPIAKLHYIDLPVSLTYKPVEPLRIHMGLKASYLLHANADWQNHSQNGVSDPSDFEFRNDRDDALYESMKKFDFGTVLGFGYYPVKNFGVDIRYNHGLIDNTIDEVWQTRQITTNKTFELTLTYLMSK